MCFELAAPQFALVGMLLCTMVSAVNMLFDCLQERWERDPTSLGNLSNDTTHLVSQ